MRLSSFLDYPRPTLDPSVWTDGKPSVLNSDVEKAIQKGLSEFLVAAELSKNDLKAVFVVGSITGYQWFDSSDVDVTIIIKGEENPKDLIRMRTLLRSLNGQLSVKTHPINYYVIYESSIREDLSRYDAAYDFFERKWLKKPASDESFDPYIQFRDILDMAKTYARDIDLQVGEAKRDLADYKYLFDQLKKSSPEIRVVIRKHLSDTRDKLDLDIRELLGELKDISALREKAFEKDLEGTPTDKWEELAYKYKSKNLLPEALIYKALEKWKYIELLHHVADIASDESKDYSSLSEEDFDVR